MAIEFASIERDDEDESRRAKHADVPLLVRKLKAEVLKESIESEMPPTNPAMQKRGQKVLPA